MRRPYGTVHFAGHDNSVVRFYSPHVVERNIEAQSSQRKQQHVWTFLENAQGKERSRGKLKPEHKHIAGCQAGGWVLDVMVTFVCI